MLFLPKTGNFYFFHREANALSEWSLKKESIDNKNIHLPSALG